ncbi:DUF4932 domain-containing protein [Thermococcus indicus]|uniref:DUF4932 domain-containing protein n=1 Tax=Thermococcus indicus TaxID=2586643 RepID=A0A4Y5SIX7_9EURY|nr:DUF4932 domain-containing protein [Thermococcus indicus]
MPKVKPLVVPLSLLIILSTYYLSQPWIQTKPTFQLGIFLVSKCSDNVCLEINPYVELTNVVFYLAGWDSSNSTPYAREVESYFSPYRNHKAVLLARKALRAGLSYDAIPKFALELNSTEWSEYLIARVHGNEKLLNELARAIEEFVQDSNFLDFYENHKEFYREQIRLFFRENPNVFDIPHFVGEFFGEKQKRWVFILQPLEMYYNYGGSINSTVYAFLGVCSVSGGSPQYCNASVHEMAHSFINLP